MRRKLEPLDGSPDRDPVRVVPARGTGAPRRIARAWWRAACGAYGGAARWSAVNLGVMLLLTLGLVAGFAQVWRGTEARDVHADRSGVRSSREPVSGTGTAMPAAYTPRLRNPRLFAAPPEKRAQAPRRNVTLAELSKSLRLQGILGGAQPRALLVDEATKKTYQVGVGQYIGAIQIEAIHRTRVVLRWNDQTLELSL